MFQMIRVFQALMKYLYRSIDIYEKRGKREKKCKSTKIFRIGDRRKGHHKQTPGVAATLGFAPEARISTNVMSRFCSLCTGNISGEGERAVCPACDAETTQVKQWSCPRGRPSNSKFHPDLNEWLIDGVIPKDKYEGLTGSDNVLPARLIEPWSALGKKEKRSSAMGGVYDGYISSLLVSLHFQTQNDELYLQDMDTQEKFLTGRLFDADPDTKVLNPFRIKIWDNEKFFNGKLSEMLKGIFGESFKLTYKGIFRKKSEQFCQLILNQVKKQENHPRIVKYFGSLWTSNTIRNLIPEFDDYLKQFKDKLNTIVGSSLNNCFTITPPNKKQKVVKTFASFDNFDVPQFPSASLAAPLGDLSDGGKELSSVFDSPRPKKATGHSQEHISAANMLNKLYCKIFMNKTLRFVDENFQSTIMKHFAEFKSESDDNGKITLELMKFVIKENIEVSNFVRDYMGKKDKENQGIFDCEDFAESFTQKFLKMV